MTCRWPTPSSPSHQYSLLPVNAQRDDDDRSEKLGYRMQGYAAATSTHSSWFPRQWQRFGSSARLLIIITILNALLAAFSLSTLASYKAKGGASPIHTPTYAHLTAPTSTNSTTPISDTFVGDITHYLVSHPPSNAENSTFAQMGLFTRLYARLLQDSSTSSIDVLKSFESSLWFFAPGIGKLRSRQQDASLQHTRGIAVPVGSATFPFAIHLISTIRSVHKSDMPIEVVYRDDNDLPEKMRSYLTSTFSNIKTISLVSSGYFDDATADVRGWAMKPFSAVASSFNQVILADADTIFLTPPEDFFDQEDYKRTGTLFFSDRDVPRKGDETKDERIHEWLNVQMGGNSPSESLANSYFWKKKGIYRQESGIVLLDKRRNHVFAALLFAAWQNIKDIRHQVTYDLFWGDKESFWLSFELARFPYYLNNHGAGSLGSVEVVKNNRFCVEHPLHFFEAPEGTPRLIEERPPIPANRRHLLRPAWMNGSLRENKINKESKKFIDVNKAMWTMDGTWFWGDKESLNCQRDYTPHSMHEFDLGYLFTQLEATAEAAETSARAYLDGHRAP